MRPLGIVAIQVILQILLYFFQGSIEFRAPLDAQVLLKQGSVKPFHQPIALRPAGLGYQGGTFRLQPGVACVCCNGYDFLLQKFNTRTR